MPNLFVFGYYIAGRRIDRASFATFPRSARLGVAGISGSPSIGNACWRRKLTIHLSTVYVLPIERMQTF